MSGESKEFFIRNKPSRMYHNLITNETVQKIIKCKQQQKQKTDSKSLLHQHEMFHRRNPLKGATHVSQLTGLD